MVLHHIFHYHYFTDCFPAFREAYIDNWKRLLTQLQDIAFNPKYDVYGPSSEIITKDSFDEIGLGLQVDELFDGLLN